MIRAFLSWLRPDPPRTVRVLFDGYETPARRDREKVRAFRVRQIDAVLSGSECYDMRDEDDRRAA